MSVTLSPVGGAGAQFFDNNGNPLSGGKLYTYAAGTTTPVSTYTSAAGSTLHTNPIVLDSAGRVPGSSEIWLTDGVIYKFLLKTSVDVTLATWDNITGVNSNFVNFTAESEYQTATAGQTVFTLTTMTYSPGTGNLTVYVDGVNQYLGTSYVETDGVTVTFTAGLHVGALVKFTTAVETTGNATDASVVTYTPAGTGAVTTTVQAKLRESVSVKDFGAVGDGVTDDTAAIQAAIDAAETLSVATSRGATSPQIRSSFPAVVLYIPAGKYLISSQLIVGQISSRYKLLGEASLIFANNGTMASDYLIKVVGAFDSIFEGLNLVSTETGCLEFATPNVTPAMVQINNVTFIGNVSTTSRGTAIKYNCQSSHLTVRECLFFTVQYAFEQFNGDFTSFTHCRFTLDAPDNYPDDAGYFINPYGEFVLQDCLFDAGPGATTGQRVAYFTCSSEVNLTIRRTRISFEGGGGPVINWKVPINVASGSFQRCGFTLDDITVSPRGQNVTYGATAATPLVRLYEMPNKMIFKNISWRNSVQGVIGVAPTTTLETLYNAAKSQISGFSQTAYSYNECVGNSMYFVETSDVLTHQKWLELFNIFDYGFRPEILGSEQTNKYKTFFTGNDFSNVFEVSGWIDMSPGARFSKQWLVSTTYNASTGNYAFVTDIQDTVGTVNSRNVTLTPKFYNIGTAAYTDTIAITEDLNDYLLAFDITSITSTEFACDNLYVRPMQAFNKTNGFVGTPRQVF